MLLLLFFLLLLLVCCCRLLIFAVFNVFFFLNFSLSILSSLLPSAPMKSLAFLRCYGDANSAFAPFSTTPISSSSRLPVACSLRSPSATMAISWTPARLRAAHRRRRRLLILTATPITSSRGNATRFLFAPSIRSGKIFPFVTTL